MHHIHAVLDTLCLMGGIYKSAATISAKNTCWDALKHCGLCRLDLLGRRSSRTTSSDG